MYGNLIQQNVAADPAGAASRRSEWFAAFDKARPLQRLRHATSLLERSIGSGSGSRENWTKVRERLTCSRLEQMRRRERLRNSAESSEPKAWGGGRTAW